MKMPDLSNDAEMAKAGRLAILRKTRRDAARELRDLLVPMLNAIEGERASWNIQGVKEHCDFIEYVTNEIEALQAIAPAKEPA